MAETMVPEIMKVKFLVHNVGLIITSHFCLIQYNTTGYFGLIVDQPVPELNTSSPPTLCTGNKPNMVSQ